MLFRLSTFQHCGREHFQHPSLLWEEVLHDSGFRGLGFKECFLFLCPAADDSTLTHYRLSNTVKQDGLFVCLLVSFHTV